jgi:hypothetical protein
LIAKTLSLAGSSQWFRPALIGTLLLLGHWQIFDIWFRTDDFVWLGLKDVPLKDALFTPGAQGTLRTLSERLPFLLIGKFLGPVPEAFRILALLTLFGSSTLLSLLALRLSGSTVAALLVPIIWILNPGVASALCWASSYNQILFSFVALATLLAFIENRPVLCWIPFLAGFLTLELNVGMPGVLLLYCLLFAHERWKETLAFFGASLAFAIWHLFFVEHAAAEYRMTFDLSVVHTLWKYVQLAIGATAYGSIQEQPMVGVVFTGIAITGAALSAWLADPQTKRIIWFGYGCFVLLLLPVLPLKDHVTDYYVCSASLGLAIAIGCAFRLWASYLPMVILISFGWLVGGESIRWYTALTQRILSVVEAVQVVHRDHPNDTIVLHGIDPEIYWNGIYENPFRVLDGMQRVYLSPGSRAVLNKAEGARRDMAKVQEMSVENYAFLMARKAPLRNYRVDLNGRLQGLSAAVASRLVPANTGNAPRSVEPGNSDYLAALSDNWLHPERPEQRDASGHIWMGRLATVSMSLPRTPNEVLRIEGYVPQELNGGQANLSIRINGTDAGSLSIRRPGSGRWDVPVVRPVNLTEPLRVELQLDHTFRVPTDHRELGMLIRLIEWAPGPGQS